MKILNPNSGSETECIPKSDIYVRVTDYGSKYILKSIKVQPGQYTWYWVPFISSGIIDISNIGGKFCTFDFAINRAVNDAYSTVYSFNTLDGFIKQWEVIKYIESISTTFKGEDK
jgi:hypothetical protein